MSDIALPLRAVLWGMVAIGVLCVAALGLVVQPIVIWLARGGRATTSVQRVGYFLGPTLALTLAWSALVVVRYVSDAACERLDRYSPLLPLVALALWVGCTVGLLRARPARVRG